MVKCPATTKVSPKGRFWRQLVADTIQRGPYRTALREREDDILPYRGRGILAGTIQPGASKCYCFHRGNEPGGLGHPLDW